MEHVRPLFLSCVRVAAGSPQHSRGLGREQTVGHGEGLLEIGVVVVDWGGGGGGGGRQIGSGGWVRVSECVCVCEREREMSSNIQGDSWISILSHCYYSFLLIFRESKAA